MKKQRDRVSERVRASNGRGVEAGTSSKRKKSVKKSKEGSAETVVANDLDRRLRRMEIQMQRLADCYAAKQSESKESLVKVSPPVQPTPTKTKSSIEIPDLAKNGCTNQDPPVKSMQLGSPLRYQGSVPSEGMSMPSCTPVAPPAQINAPIAPPVPSKQPIVIDNQIPHSTVSPSAKECRQSPEGSPGQLDGTTPHSEESSIDSTSRSSSHASNIHPTVPPLDPKVPTMADAMTNTTPIAVTPQPSEPSLTSSNKTQDVSVASPDTTMMDRECNPETSDKSPPAIEGVAVRSVRFAADTRPDASTDDVPDENVPLSQLVADGDLPPFGPNSASSPSPVNDDLPTEILPEPEEASDAPKFTVPALAMWREVSRLNDLAEKRKQRLLSRASSGTSGLTDAEEEQLLSAGTVDPKDGLSHRFRHLVNSLSELNKVLGFESTGGYMESTETTSNIYTKVLQQQKERREAEAKLRELEAERQLRRKARGMGKRGMTRGTGEDGYQDDELDEELSDESVELQADQRWYQRITDHTKGRAAAWLEDHAHRVRARLPEGSSARERAAAVPGLVEFFDTGHITTVDNGHCYRPISWEERRKGSLSRPGEEDRARRVNTGNGEKGESSGVAGRANPIDKLLPIPPLPGDHAPTKALSRSHPGHGPQHAGAIVGSSGNQGHKTGIGSRALVRAGDPGDGGGDGVEDMFQTFDGWRMPGPAANRWNKQEMVTVNGVKYVWESQLKNCRWRRISEQMNQRQGDLKKLEKRYKEIIEIHKRLATSSKLTDDIIRKGEVVIESNPYAKFGRPEKKRVKPSSGSKARATTKTSKRPSNAKKVTASSHAIGRLSKKQQPGDGSETEAAGPAGPKGSISNTRKKHVRVTSPDGQASSSRDSRAEAGPPGGKDVPSTPRGGRAGAELRSDPSASPRNRPHPSSPPATSHSRGEKPRRSAQGAPRPASRPRKRPSTAPASRRGGKVSSPQHEVDRSWRASLQAPPKVVPDTIGDQQRRRERMEAKRAEVPPLRDLPHGQATTVNGNSNPAAEPVRPNDDQENHNRPHWESSVGHSVLDRGKFARSPAAPPRKPSDVLRVSEHAGLGLSPATRQAAKRPLSAGEDRGGDYANTSAHGRGSSGRTHTPPHERVGLRRGKLGSNSAANSISAPFNGGRLGVQGNAVSM